MTDTPRPIPRWGVVAGLGKVRVLSYEGNGRWMVLDNKDTRRFVDKSRLTFTKR